MDWSNQLFILLDILIAAILSGAVGFEREKREKPAGFRTHMIVGSVSCLLVSIGSVLLDTFHNYPFQEALRADPFRIIEAIIVGVSFIGAGTILKSEKEERIRFLTSSATILFSAGIGISVALQQYVLALGVSILALIINVVFKLIDRKMDQDEDH
ncbi:MAG: MgtC/SapB family protein [Candidatus Cyclobacteriaceae bacterium M3_2C_046]